MKSHFSRLRAPRMILRFRTIIAIIVASVSSTTAHGFQAYTAIADGSWSDPAVWSPAGGPPTAGDYVFIENHAMTLSSDSSAYQIWVTGGTLDLNGHLLTANQLELRSANESLPLIKNGGRLNLD